MVQIAQISMNARTPRQTSAILTLHVITLKGLTPVAVLKDIRVMAKTAQLSSLVALHLVVQTRSVKKIADLILLVSVTLVTKVTGTTVQMSMSAPAMRQMSVTPTPCVLTLKHLMCAAVQLDSLEMAEIVQISTNAKVLKQTSVTSTPCVPTLKDPMFVAVEVVILATAKIA